MEYMVKGQKLKKGDAISTEGDKACETEISHKKPLSIPVLKLECRTTRRKLVNKG